MFLEFCEMCRTSSVSFERSLQRMRGVNYIRRHRHSLVVSHLPLSAWIQMPKVHSQGGCGPHASMYHQIHSLRSNTPVQECRESRAGFMPPHVKVPVSGSLTGSIRPGQLLRYRDICEACRLVERSVEQMIRLTIPLVNVLLEYSLVQLRREGSITQRCRLA